MLSRFDYSIKHIPGLSNAMADILSRWKIDSDNNPTFHRDTVKVQATSNANPSVISKESILKMQQGADPPSDGMVSDSDGLMYVRDKIWVPDERSLEFIIALWRGHLVALFGAKLCLGLLETTLLTQIWI